MGILHFSFGKTDDAPRKLRSGRSEFRNAALIPVQRDGSAPSV